MAADGEKPMAIDTCRTRMERALLGLSPELRTPPGQEPDNARRGRDRPSSTDLKQRSTSST
jgi:hypothetical protein